jgi:hypothetical protein
MAAERWPCSGVVFVDVAEKKVGFGMGNLIFLPLRKTRFVWAVSRCGAKEWIHPTDLEVGLSRAVQ